MKKPFCDVCGEPAIDNAYVSAAIRTFDGSSCTRKFCNIDASVTMGGEINVKHTDPRADICRACFAKGLRQLADKVEGTVTK